MPANHDCPYESSRAIPLSVASGRAVYDVAFCKVSHGWVCERCIEDNEDWRAEWIATGVRPYVPGEE